MVLYPSQSALNEVFSTRTQFRRTAPEPSRRPNSKPNFSIWNVAEDAKKKAGALSAEAKAELSKASNATQAKTGQIELYSSQYYAACTFGGLIACVGVGLEYRAVVAHKWIRASPILR